VQYQIHLEIERNNITEPGEAELVARLGTLTERYIFLGNRFFAPNRTAMERTSDYYGISGRPGELHTEFLAIKAVAREIRQLNQQSMEKASAEARATAATARLWASLGLLAALLATGLLAWRTTRTLLRPIEDLTISANAVGAGRFDRRVTVETRDEIGELVAAFNRMTTQLQDLKQSDAAQFLRAQQASQAAIDSFPDPVLLVDPDGRVEMANPAARQLLGTRPAAVRMRIEMLERVLERAFVIPGINRPIGLDSIMGFLPVGGDILAGAMGLYLVWEARNLGLPKWQIARMMANVGIDTALGAIPLAGDLFDFLFRSNSKNLRIIKRHLDKHHPGTARIDIAAPGKRLSHD